MSRISLCALLATGLFGSYLLSCGSSDDEQEVVQGKSEIYLHTDALNVLEVTFLKGRVCGRLTIDANSTTAQAAIIAFAKFVAGSIPLDGSAPASDQALVAIMPKPPLTGEFAAWIEDSTDGLPGPRLESTSAFAWINGSGQPFDDNGFEAVAVENYLNNADSWRLQLSVVNLSNVTGAEKAFRGMTWDNGTKVE